MNLKLITSLIGITLSLFAKGAYAEELHMEIALKHAEAAVGAVDGKSVAKYAERSKIHAKATEEHLVTSIISLDSAIEFGKAGNDKKAKEAAAEAVMHLKAAQ